MRVSYNFTHVGCDIEERKMSKFVARKRERKRQRWKYNIRWKDIFKEIGCVVDWIHLAASSEHGKESLDSTITEKS